MMSKDKRIELHKCARCQNWMDDEEATYCPKCEAEYLETHEPEYDDPLDQARADSMAGE